MGSQPIYMAHSPSLPPFRGHKTILLLSLLTLLLPTSEHRLCVVTLIAQTPKKVMITPPGFHFTSGEQRRGGELQLHH